MERSISLGAAASASLSTVEERFQTEPGCYNERL